MEEDKQKLMASGRMLVPIFAGYAAIEAIYHSGDDLIFKTTPRLPPPIWQDKASEQALSLGFKLSFHDDSGSLLIVAKEVKAPSHRIPWLNILLFAATVVSMVIAYSFMSHGSGIFKDFSLMVEGVYFALSLTPILLFHEFGHYLAAKKHKANVSLPYFIPAPTIIGTLGAVIKSRSPFRNRRQLFDVGVAGPLAGMIPTLIILIIGFSTAGVEKIPEMTMDGSFIFIGESLAFKLLFLIFGPTAPEGYQVVLSPLIFAGWVGMLVTMLNMMPIGQLDGGHVLYAMFGRKWQFRLALVMFVAMLIMGFWWYGWFLWAFLAAVIIKLRHPATLDDSIMLDRRRLIFGWLAIVIFVVIFMPVPIGFVEG